MRFFSSLLGKQLAGHGAPEHVGTVTGAAASAAILWRIRKGHLSRCNARKPMIWRWVKARESPASVLRRPSKDFG